MKTLWITAILLMGLLAPVLAQDIPSFPPLKNHPQTNNTVGAETPDMRIPDAAAAAAGRFENNASVERAKADAVAADVDRQAACTPVPSTRCMAATSQLKHRQANLFLSEEQAATAEADYWAAQNHALKQKMDAKPDFGAMTQALDDLVQTCGNDADCQKLRTRLYQTLPSHVADWEPILALAREAQSMFVARERHFRNVANVQHAQRVLALREQAEYEYLAGVQEILAKIQSITTEGDPLPKGTVLYPQLVR